MDNNLIDLAARLQSIIDTAIDGIITIDSRGNVESINHAACALFGYKVDEVIGHNIKMLMPDPYRSQHDEYIKAYHATKKPKIIGIGREVIGLKKSGRQFPFRLAVSKVALNDRIIFTGVVHDLTDVRDAQDNLVNLNEELESIVQARTNELESVINQLLVTNKKLENNRFELRASLEKEKELNELKTRFLSMASHEFRTPLSAILSSASIISKYKENGEQLKRLKHIDRIKSAVSHLNQVLTDFLTIGRFDEHMVMANIEEMKIGPLCKEIQVDLEGLLKPEQKIKLSVINELIVKTDRNILRNILFNLLSNAIKFSPKGSIITWRVDPTLDGYRMSIRDTGIGIPIEEQKYLSDRFFRASNASTIEGTGLGLHIISKYLTLLGGDFRIVSEVNNGTEVIINLPNS